MNLVYSFPLILLLTLMNGLGAGVAAAAAAQDFAAVERSVRQAMPSTRIDSVTPSPIAGLVEVVADRNVFYADTSGRWLLVGHLYDLETASDVTAERKSRLTRIAWEDLPLDAAVRHGQGPLKLAVFSDPDCPWCRRLNDTLRQAEDIEVWEIMFPVPALHPEARVKSAHILCDAQPAEALARVMGGKESDGVPPSAECIERSLQRIDRAMAFGRTHGIQGTPTLVAPDGRVRSGYLPVDELRAWIRQGETESGQ